MHNTVSREHLFPENLLLWEPSHGQAIFLHFKGGRVAELKKQNKIEKSFLSPGIFATSLLYNKCIFPAGLRAPLSCLGRGAIHSWFTGEGRSHTLFFHSLIAQNQELSTRHYLIKTRHSLRAPYTFRKQGQSALHDQTSQWRRERSFSHHAPQACLKNRTTFSSRPPQVPTLQVPTQKQTEKLHAHRSPWQKQCSGDAPISNALLKTKRLWT